MTKPREFWIGIQGDPLFPETECFIVYRKEPVQIPGEEIIHVREVLPEQEGSATSALQAPLFSEAEIEKLISDCEQNEIVAANSGWSLVQIIKTLRTRVAELEKAVSEAIDLVKWAPTMSGDIDYIHRWNDWLAKWGAK
jgi:hypothetical protein